MDQADLWADGPGEGLAERWTERYLGFGVTEAWL